MNARQNAGRAVRQGSTTSTRRGRRVVAATGLVVGLAALPAAARQDPGQVDTPAPPSTAVYFCPPERVGTLFIACDNLSGKGVPAPRWVHER